MTVMQIICIIATGILISSVLFCLIKKKYTLSCIIVSIGAILYYSAHHIYKQKESSKLIVAVSPDYPPYCCMREGKVYGIDISILETIAKKLNKRLEFQTVSFNFLFTYLDKDKSQIAASGLSFTAERAKKCQFSKEYVPFICGIIYNNRLIIDKNFTGNIGVQTGSIYTKIAKGKFPLANIVEMEDFLMLSEALKGNNNRIDALLGDILVLVEIFGTKSHNLSVKKLNIPTDYENIGGSVFAINNNIDEVKFNKALIEAIKENHYLNNLLAQVTELPVLED